MRPRAAHFIAAWLVIAGCSSAEHEVEPPAPVWVYGPAPVPVRGAPAIGRIGRSQPPQLPRVLGIEGSVRVPLRLATPWAVPVGKDGKARAIIYGVEGARSAVEMIDVDAGRVLWRDTKACAGPVVGVTANAIVCADAAGVRGVGHDGKPKWKAEAAYLAMSEDRVVTQGPGEAIVLDADTGDELAHVKLPASVMTDSVIASCGDAGRELFAAGQDGNLVRIAEAKGGPSIAWAVPIGRIDDLDACTGDTVLVREAGAFGGTLVAIARATGKVTGRVPAVHGFWKARDGSDRIEIATSEGIEAWPRTLTGEPTITSPLVLGELLAEHGDSRLVRATAATAVVLDHAGVRAYLPFAALGAVMGDDAIVGGSWSGSTEMTVRRIGLPARYRKQLRLSPARGGVALPAELRDLPLAETTDAARAIAKPDSGKHAVLDVAIDPVASHVLYTLQLEKADDETGTPSVAAFDLATRAWRWQRPDACGTGEAIGLAVTRDVVVCASRTRTSPTAIVRATSKDGAARWEWEGDHIDHLAAAGDVVIVGDADRAIVLDAATGKARWQLASDDGGRVRAAAVALGATTLIVGYERGRLVTRVAGGWPLWSIDVDGVVTSVTASGAGVLVTLEDGDAYRIDLPSGAIHALPGIDLDWRATGDLIAASTAGGPIPGTPVPAEPLRVLQPLVKKKPAPKPAQANDADAERPRLWTPIPPPPPLGDSWQLTLYELGGGFRVRNDYALYPPIAPVRERGPDGSPLVVASGPGLRIVLVIDPRTGDPKRRILLGEDAAPGLVFSTIVDGAPVAGAVLQQPLRIVLF